MEPKDELKNENQNFDFSIKKYGIGNIKFYFVLIFILLIVPLIIFALLSIVLIFIDYYIPISIQGTTGLFVTVDINNYFFMIVLYIIEDLPYILFVTLFGGIISMIFFKFPLTPFIKIYLRLSKRRWSPLNYIPFVEFDGVWVMEENSEEIALNSVKGVANFITSRKWGIFLFPILGNILIQISQFSAELFLTRPISWLIETSVNAQIATSNIHPLVPIFANLIFIVLGSYIVIFIVLIIWTLDDAEIKITKVKTSSKGQNNEITRLSLASLTIRRILFLIMITDSFVFYYIIEDILSTSYIGRVDFSQHSPMLVVLLFLSFILDSSRYLIPISYYMLFAFFYFYSGVHQRRVNSIRQYVLKEQSKKSSAIDIEIGKSSFDAFEEK